MIDKGTVKNTVSFDQMPHTFADDPIPANAITLSEAFQRVVKALSGKQELLERTLEEYNLTWKQDLENVEPRFREEAAANAFFRCHLIWGAIIYGEHLYAFVRNPKNELVLKLNPKGWEPQPRPPVYLGKRKKPDYEPISNGLDFDYVIDPFDSN
jgi:hypothetical protein